MIRVSLLLPPLFSLPLLLFLFVSFRQHYEKSDVVGATLMSRRIQSFPRKNADLLKKFRSKTESHSVPVHGCRISPDLADITCASQERATPRFSRIAAGKTIFLHFRCSHETYSFGVKQITP